MSNIQPPTKLLNRNFVLLWIGQSVSQFGSQGFSIAMLFWIKHATGSASLMGLMLMMSALPGVLLGPIGGVFADRYSRRSIIILSNVAMGAASLSLGVLMLAAPRATSTTLVWLFITSTIISVVVSFFSPAIYAASPDLVPRDKVPTANSLGQVSYELSMFFGQGLGGTLFRLLGAPVLFVLDGLSHLLSGASAILVTIPQTLPEHNSSWREQLRSFRADTIDGLRYAWRQSGLRDLILASAFLNFFNMPIITLLPFYVEDSLRLSVDWYGFLIAAYGLGSVVGYLAAGASRLEGRARSRAMLSFMVMEGSGYALLGFARGPLPALAIAVISGCASGFVAVYITTVLQLGTPGFMRGRVYGVASTLAASISPLASGLSGIVADLTGQNIPLIYLGCGAAMALISLSLGLRSSFREFLAAEALEEAPAEAERTTGTPQGG